ncbi:MAG: hypothetical protein JRM88_07110 [Nitrososphaerota archaeon]|jgi:hypothetical protein|nr:hypothetical protein [Nitrososphaerota archaeon]MDG6949846.1 hypothetical protein [Nitrososphaerota archaeon]
MVFDLASLFLPVIALVDTILIGLSLWELRFRRKEIKSREEEIKKRDEMVDAVGDAVGKVRASVGEIGRKKINLALAGSIQEAKVSVHHVSLGFSVPEEDPMKEDMLEALLEAIKTKSKDPNVEILFVGAPSIEKLRGAFLRKKYGAAVRLSDDARRDLRFQVVDEKIAVLGVAPSPSHPSEIGYEIMSDELAEMFERRFQQIWNSPKTVDYDAFAKAAIERVITTSATSNTSFASINTLSGAFGFRGDEGEDEIKRLIGEMGDKVTLYQGEFVLFHDGFLQVVSDCQDRLRSSDPSVLAKGVASELGLPVDESCVKNALAELKRTRGPDGKGEKQSGAQN